MKKSAHGTMARPRPIRWMVLWFLCSASSAWALPPCSAATCAATRWCSHHWCGERSAWSSRPRCGQGSPVLEVVESGDDPPSPHASPPAATVPEPFRWSSSRRSSSSCPRSCWRSGTSCPAAGSEGRRPVQGRDRMRASGLAWGGSDHASAAGTVSSHGRLERVVQCLLRLHLVHPWAVPHLPWSRGRFDVLLPRSRLRP